MDVTNQELSLIMMHHSHHHYNYSPQPFTSTIHESISLPIQHAYQSEEIIQCLDQVMIITG